MSDERDEERERGVVDLSGEELNPEEVYREIEAGTEADADAGSEGTPGGDPEATSAVAELQRELDELRERYLRTLADLENLRKRYQRNALELRKFGHEVAIKELLPVLDNLERALEAAAQNTEAAVARFMEGIERIVQQFRNTLQRLGVEEVPSEEQPFNPEVHEAIQEVESTEYPDSTVVHTMEKGYKLHDRLLRPAKVVVARRPQSTASEDGAPSESEGVETSGEGGALREDAAPQSGEDTGQG